MPKGLKTSELPEQRHLFFRLRVADNQIIDFAAMQPRSSEGRRSAHSYTGAIPQDHWLGLGGTFARGMAWQSRYTDNDLNWQEKGGKIVKKGKLQ